ncbi:MAG: hypothetical protein H6985_18595 [Pseudomonadales bacterium]|nr:hypothetical protein [Halioglobus sp.]MCP5131578.1 hypothetical protein [Pseudomonadales bacterium]
MNTLMNHLGTVAGLVGLLVCAVSGMARIAGGYYLANYEITSLFVAGTGLMVFACLLKLEVLIRTRV